jgi:hypothetical protein
MIKRCNPKKVFASGARERRMQTNDYRPTGQERFTEKAQEIAVSTAANVDM